LVEAAGVLSEEVLAGASAFEVVDGVAFFAGVFAAGFAGVAAAEES
jgi:hypothetical protein